MGGVWSSNPEQRFSGLCETAAARIGKVAQRLPCSEYERAIVLNLGLTLAAQGRVPEAGIRGFLQKVFSGALGDDVLRMTRALISSAGDDPQAGCDAGSPLRAEVQSFDEPRFQAMREIAFEARKVLIASDALGSTADVAWETFRALAKDACGPEHGRPFFVESRESGEPVYEMG